MKSQSLISILVPAYNHEKYVEGCVRSVLAQDWPNVELLVVDDGSKDATWAKLQGLRAECERKLARVEMVTQENRGTSFTWARLRGMARGEFILTLASDDELAPEALSALVKPMLKDRRIGVVVGQNSFMDGEGRTCYWNRALETVYDTKEARYRSLNEAICSFADVKQFSRQFGDYGRLLKDNYVANGCLIRASELAAVEFPSEQVPLEDYWVHLQLSKRTRYKAIRETTFRYRWHATNTSHLREKMKEMTRRIYDFEEQCLRAADDSHHLTVFNEVRSGISCSVWRRCFHRPSLVKYRQMRGLQNWLDDLRSWGRTFCRRTRRHTCFLSLGLDTEPAIRYLQVHGCCPPALFQGGSFPTFGELVAGLEKWSLLFADRDPGFGVCYRLAADDRELRQMSKGVLCLKRNFVKSLGQGGALVVCKIPQEDWILPDCADRVRRLVAALRNLGAVDFDCLIVLERNCRSVKREISLPRVFVRYVSHFERERQSTMNVKGDKSGWRRIFSEFRPVRDWASVNRPQALLRAGPGLLVVRRNDPIMGLCGHFLANLGWMKYACDRGFVPYMDISLAAGGTWNSYFRQEVEDPIVAAGSARSVQIIQGGAFPPVWPNPHACSSWLHEGDGTLARWRQFVAQHIRVNAEVQVRVDEMRKRLFGDAKDILGCLVRGTDYLRMKPAGHPVQPDPAVVISDVEKALTNERFSKVFLVSEDAEIREAFVRKFGERVVVAQTTLPNYSSGYLASSGALGDAARMAEITLQYFVSILLLARCRCLIAGCTGGSVSAMLLSGGYRWSRIYNLGSYV